MPGAAMPGATVPGATMPGASAPGAGAGRPPRFGAEQQVVQRRVQLGSQRVQDAHRRHRDPALDLRDEAGRTPDPARQLAHGQRPLLAGQAQPGAEPRLRIEASRHDVNVHCTLLAANLDSPTAHGIGWLVRRADTSSRRARSFHGRGRTCTSPDPRARPDVRRLRGEARLRPAAPVPPRPRQSRYGKCRAGRAAGLRQQQHQVPDRRRHRRVDQGQAVPLRAVHPHRRAGPVGLRLGRGAPPDVLPVAEAGELHRLLHHHARRRPARLRAHAEAGRGDQGPPQRSRSKRRAHRRRLGRGPHLLRAAKTRPAK